MAAFLNTAVSLIKDKLPNILSPVKNNKPTYDTEEAAKDAIAKSIKAIIDGNSDSINELYKQSFINLFNNLETNKHLLENEINSFILSKIFSSIQQDNVIQKSLFYILVYKYPQKNIEDVLNKSTPNTLVSNFIVELETNSQIGGNGLMDTTVFKNIVNTNNENTNKSNIVNTNIVNNTDKTIDQNTKNITTESNAINDTREISKILDFYPKDITTDTINEEIFYIIKQSFKEMLDKKENTDLLYKKITENIIPQIQTLLNNYIKIMGNNDLYILKQLLLSLLKNNEIQKGLKDCYSSNYDIFISNTEKVFKLMYQKKSNNYKNYKGGNKKGLKKETKKSKQKQKKKTIKRKQMSSKL
jgi:hypothetical protein